MVADARKSLERGEYTMFPNGFSGVFFNFGNTGSIIVKEEYRTPAVSVFGQIDRHFTAVHWPGFYSVGVLVKPCALSSLLKIDMSEITNRSVDGVLIDKTFKTLHDQLAETCLPGGMAAGVAQQLAIIEQFFINRFNFSEEGLSHNAIEMFATHPDFGIEKISSELGVSQRHLEIKFRREVGVSPKTYSLIMRFKRMEEQLRVMPAVRWRDMSFAHDYHDQNHFIKDFKRFTGHTPSDYLLNTFEIGRAYLSAR
jgi:AraC-like DNA-binding protein